METKLKHRLLGLFIGSLLTFVTLDMISKISINALLLAVLIGSLIANIVAIVVGFLILVSIIIIGINYLRKKLK
jgi:hypothetical protein